jgi:VanZ family protein
LKLKRHNIWPLALVLVIFAASSHSSLATPVTGFSYDKLTHFLVFGLLATSVLRIPYFLNKRWRGILLTILIVSSYGVIDEFRQMFTDGRSVEFKDWVADTSGAILASILYLKWNWYRQILEKHFLSKTESTLARS